MMVLYLISIGQQTSTFANEVNENAPNTLQANDSAPSSHLGACKKKNNEKGKENAGGESNRNGDGNILDAGAVAVDAHVLKQRIAKSLHVRGWTGLIYRLLQSN